MYKWKKQHFSCSRQPTLLYRRKPKDLACSLLVEDMNSADLKWLSVQEVVRADNCSQTSHWRFVILQHTQLFWLPMGTYCWFHIQKIWREFRANKLASLQPRWKSLNSVLQIGRLRGAYLPRLHSHFYAQNWALLYLSIILKLGETNAVSKILSIRDIYKEKFYKILEINIFTNKYSFAVELVNARKTNSAQVVSLQWVSLLYYILPCHIQLVWALFWYGRKKAKVPFHYGDCSPYLWHRWCQLLKVSIFSQCPVHS